ncbi:MAG: prepilin-type N-terminal cleavage/methylation domain-containing protein [Eubacteriales bacterium]|nr:prepilin-type N-terminal cleavage/methylation domain-containing protein [Eubacteriales bacterium]
MNLHNNKGFTVVELLSALVILLIVVTLGYQTFAYVYSSYDRNEESWIVQQDVRKVSDWIDKNAQTAYILEIYAAKPAAFDAADEYYYLYNEAGKVYIRNPKETSAVHLSGETIDTVFSFDAGEPNALHYDIVGKDLKTALNEVYTVEGTLLILNLTNGKKINEGDPAGIMTSGKCIRFKSTADNYMDMYNYNK